MWKEKQRQVKTEEEKTKNSKSVVFDTRTSNLVLSRPQVPGAGDLVQEECWNKHKWVISDVCCRELWTDQAEILIQQVPSAGVLVILKTGCCFWNCSIPLTNRVRGSYCKLRTEFFSFDLWPKGEARGP